MNGFTVAFKHPEYGSSHFKIAMDEMGNITALGSPEWLTYDIISDILLAIANPNK